LHELGERRLLQPSDHQHRCVRIARAHQYLVARVNVEWGREMHAKRHNEHSIGHGAALLRPSVGAVELCGCILRGGTRGSVRGLEAWRQEPGRRNVPV